MHTQNNALEVEPTWFSTYVKVVGAGSSSSSKHAFTKMTEWTDTIEQQPTPAAAAAVAKVVPESSQLAARTIPNPAAHLILLAAWFCSDVVGNLEF